MTATATYTKNLTVPKYTETEQDFIGLGIGFGLAGGAELMAVGGEAMTATVSMYAAGEIGVGLATAGILAGGIVTLGGAAVIAGIAFGISELF